MPLFTDTVGTGKIDFTIIKIRFINPLAKLSRLHSQCLQGFGLTGLGTGKFPNELNVAQYGSVSSQGNRRKEEKKKHFEILYFLLNQVPFPLVVLPVWFSAGAAGAGAPHEGTNSEAFTLSANLAILAAMSALFGSAIVVPGFYTRSPGFREGTFSGRCSYPASRGYTLLSRPRASLLDGGEARNDVRAYGAVDTVEERELSVILGSNFVEFFPWISGQNSQKSTLHIHSLAPAMAGQSVAVIRASLVVRLFVCKTCVRAKIWTHELTNTI